MIDYISMIESKLPARREEDPGRNGNSHGHPAFGTLDWFLRG